MEELENYIEEYIYFKDTEERLSLHEDLQRDVIISIEVPIELKMVLDMILDDVVAYDFLEYALRSCVDIVKQSNSIPNHYRIIQDKLTFFTNTYINGYGAPIHQHMMTVVYGIDTLCRYLITGMKRYGHDKWYFILIEREEVLDNTLDVSLLLETDEMIETP